ncbi:MAG: beta strand repeat-containing protein, partial [Chitinophagaceae bacterium]
MRKIFTKLTTCPEHVEGQIFSVNTASFVCGTPTTINHTKNNYKDDLANAGSFSFIDISCHPELFEGLSTDNFFNNRQPSTSNTPTPNKSFMSTLLRKSKFVAVLIAGWFFVSSSFAQSITVTGVSPNPVCAGSTATVTFNAVSGTGSNKFDATSTFTAYISSNGGVTPYTSIGTLTRNPYTFCTTNGCTNAGITGTVTIPIGTAAGTYKITLNSSGPVTVTNSTTGTGASPTFTVIAAPADQTLTGGGSYCSGGSGVPIGLAGSETGVNYQLYLNGSPVVGASVAGTGGAISFGNQTAAGTYTVVATNTTTNCTRTLTGNKTVTVNPLPNNTSTGFTGSTICPGGTGTLTFDAIDASFVAPYTITYTDGTNTFNQNIGSASPTTFNAQVNPTTTTNYTLTSITNGNNCTTTTGFGDATATITVGDNTPPSITCPGTQTLPLDANCSATVPDYTSLATKSDNCTASGSITVTQSPVAGTPVTGVGSFTVTFTATDASGKINTCSFTVNKVDNTKPTITCPGTQTLVLGSSCTAATPDYTGMATRSDNCSATASITVTQSPVVGTTQTGVGSFTVTLTATDASGNTNTCTFMVNKVDNTPPVITCPGTQTLSLGAGCSAALPNYTSLATKSDNCTAAASITVTQSPAAGTNQTGVGTLTVTLTATDGAGNSSTCNFTVNKVDITAPAITCPGAQTLNLNSGCSATVPDYRTLATTSDNCSTVTVTQSPASGSTVTGTGTFTVTLTATDVSGNSSTCNFTVTKKDVTPPSITCPGTQTLALASTNCKASLPNYTTLATTSDNCSAVTVTQSPVTGTSVTGTGSITVTLTATDVSGNTATCSFTVNKVDVTPPAITCPGTQTLNLGANCTATVPDYTGLGSASDNCSGTVTITQSPAIGSTVSGVGSFTVTLTATDASGNSSTCTFTVTVVDNEKPVITCPAPVTQNNDAGVCGATVTFAATATDNCTGTVITYSQNPGTVFPVGTTTVTATATDASKNTATCTFT